MRKISFSPPEITKQEIDEVVSVLKSGWITTGPKTKEFEKMIASYCGTSKAVCLNSATAGMELTLRLLGIGPGDEVITSAYTYTASASVICHVGATPVLVDTAEGSYEMDYVKLADAITEKTKAIIPVDLAGVMCDYQKLFQVTNDKKGIFRPVNDLQKAIGRVIILSDAAHSFGASYYGKTSGGVGDFTSFSFHAVKNLTTGEGGAVTWRDIDGIDSQQIYNQYMLLSLHGQNKDAFAKNELGAWEYDIAAPYYKCNMTDIMAALGVAQLRRYEDVLSRRHKTIETYNKAFGQFEIQLLSHKSENCISSGHLYLMRLLKKDSAYRNAFIQKMAENGIVCNVHYKPLPMMSAYQKYGFDIKDYPNARKQYENEVTLPLHTCLDEDDVAYIVHTAVQILGDSYV